MHQSTLDLTTTATGAITGQPLNLSSEPAPAVSRAVTVARPVPRRRRHRFLRTASARRALRDFRDGWELDCLTGGEFSLLDATLVLLEQTGPADVTICTYSTGLYDAEVMAHFLGTDLIRSIRWILDANFRTLAGSRGYAVEVVNVFGEERIRTTRTHAKFVLIEGEEMCVSVTSSANLNENKRIEHLQVSSDPAKARFLRGFVETVWEDVRPGWNADHGVPGLRDLDPLASPVTMGRAPTGVVTTGEAVTGRRGLGVD